MYGTFQSLAAIVDRLAQEEQAAATLLLDVCRSTHESTLAALNDEIGRRAALFERCARHSPIGYRSTPRCRAINSVRDDLVAGRL